MAYGRWIAALCGALTLIADVWGPQGHFGPHADFDFESMWDAKEFRALIRPKG